MLPRLHATPARSPYFLPPIRPSASFHSSAVATSSSRAAFLRAYDGEYRRALAGGMEPYRTFRYDVVRVWEVPPARLLAGLGTLPLAPIGAVGEADVPGVLRDMKARLGGRTPPSVADQLWSSAFVLMGLRYDQAVVRRLTEEVLGMEESSTYQFILEQGAVRELRKILLRLGARQFGSPAGTKARAALARIEDLETLERLTEAVLTADGWEALLGLPAPRPRRRRP